MKYFRLALLGFSLATLVEPAWSMPLSEEEQAYLSSKEEIVFAVQPRISSFGSIDKNQISGMDIELVQWMAEEVGFKARVVTPLTEEPIDGRPSTAACM